MAGLVPANHGFSGRMKGMDTRDKPGQDGSVFPQLGITQHREDPPAAPSIPWPERRVSPIVQREPGPSRCVS